MMRAIFIACLVLFPIQSCCKMYNFTSSDNHNNPPKFQFNHIGLSVANLEVQQEFYMNILGFNVVVQNFTLQQPIEIRTIKVQNHDGVIVELIERTGSARDEHFANPLDATKLQGYFHWALLVTDLKNTISYLNASGVRIVSEPAANLYGGKVKSFAYVADPEGNLIELLQPS
jgi:catechol 2,3-dioxygenase-like lactoylglutathione lyase family enzyme